MKTLFYRPVILIFALLFFVPNPGRASGQDADTLLHDIRTRARQAVEETKARADTAVQEIRASVGRLQKENLQIQQVGRQLNEKIHAPAGRMEQQEREAIQTATNRDSPAGSDPYDSEEAQKKAEAALLRTGSTGPKIIAVTSSSSEIVPATIKIQGLVSNIDAQGDGLVSGVVPIERAIADLNAEVTPYAIVVSLKDNVLFDFDRADIKSEAAATLTKVAVIIRKKGTGRVTVEGHTDSKGSEAYNRKLSERRAAAVANWLIARGGIAPGRFEVRGFGESRPVAPNTKEDGSDNPAGRALNRRVVIRVSTSNQTP